MAKGRTPRITKRKECNGNLANAGWYGSILTLGVLFGVIYNPDTPFTKKDLLRGLVRTASDEKYPRADLSVALGFNANVDVVVKNAPSFLRACGVVEAQSSSSHELLGSEDEFSQSFRHFLEQGAAAERSFSSDVAASRAFKKLVRCTERNSEGTSSLRVGGNAALMAVALHDRFGASVVIGGQIGDKLTKLLPDGIEYVSAKEGLTSIENVPVHVRKDEVHVIFEYGVGEEWVVRFRIGQTASSYLRTNRILLSPLWRLFSLS